MQSILYFALWHSKHNVHTSREDVELRIELGNGTTPSIVWTYQLFRVGGADTNYWLTIGEGKGVGGTYDAMAYHRSALQTKITTLTITPAAQYNIIERGGGTNFATPPTSMAGTAITVLAQINWVGMRMASYQHFTKVQMKIHPKRCSTVWWSELSRASPANQYPLTRALLISS